MIDRDTLERLREPWLEPANNADDEIQRLYSMCRVAAGEIERLRAEAERRIPNGWRPVPKASLVKLLSLIDPPPFEHEGVTRVFVNPNAADILRRVSAIVRAMLDAVPDRSVSKEPS